MNLGSSEGSAGALPRVWGLHGGGDPEAGALPAVRSAGVPGFGLRQSEGLCAGLHQADARKDRGPALAAAVVRLSPGA